MRLYVPLLGNTRYYKEAYKIFSAKVMKGGKVHRQIVYWAAILATGILVEEVFHLGSDPFQICTEIFEFYQKEGFSDPIQDAIEDYISWANSNDGRYDLSGTTYEDQEKGYSERHGVKKPGEYIAVFPHLLKDFLSKQGYSPSTILKGWKDRGWIETGKDKKRYSILVSFRNKNVRMVKIRWNIYDPKIND